MANLQFTCPKCGNNRLEEVMVDVTVVSEITDIGDGDCTYGQQTNEDGSVERYGCISCGYMPCHEDGQPVSDLEELEAWIKENCK